MDTNGLSDDERFRRAMAERKTLGGEVERLGKHLRELGGLLKKEIWPVFKPVLDALQRFLDAANRTIRKWGKR